MRYISPFRKYIFEAVKSSNNILLYRGDSTIIKKRSLDKMMSNSLYGRGLYLTTSIEIADMYKYDTNKTGLEFGLIPLEISWTIKEAKSEFWNDKMIVLYPTNIDKKYPMLHGHDENTVIRWLKENDPKEFKKRKQLVKEFRTNNEHKFEFKKIKSIWYAIDKTLLSGTITTYSVPKQYLSKVYSDLEEISPKIIDVLVHAYNDTMDSIIEDSHTTTQKDKYLRLKKKTIKNLKYEPTLAAAYEYITENLFDNDSTSLFDSTYRTLMLQRGYVGIEYKMINWEWLEKSDSYHREYCFFNPSQLTKYKLDIR